MLLRFRTVRWSAVALAPLLGAAFAACSSSTASEPTGGATTSGAGGGTATGSSATTSEASSSSGSSSVSSGSGTPAAVELTSGIPHVGGPEGYTDLGPNTTTDPLRVLLALSVKDEAGLARTLDALYDPADPAFHHYLTRAEWLERYAPTESETAAVVAWATSAGFTVKQTASNRLILDLRGTVANFNTLFHTSVHKLLNASDNWLYGTKGPLTIPADLAVTVSSMLGADGLSEPAFTAPTEATVTTTLPSNVDTAITPAKAATAYGSAQLASAGFLGQGIAIGLVASSPVILSDVQSFWQSFGITRASPTIDVLVSPGTTLDIEATLDVEWAGALAPKADLKMYVTDGRGLSLLYGFNEAIGRGEVQIVSDSYGLHEDAFALVVRQQYDLSARMATAMGVTVLGASGDSARSIVPSTSPFVTAVGGTTLTTDSAGVVQTEIAWEYTGCGASETFRVPPWQEAVSSDPMRATADLSLNSGSWDWNVFNAKWNKGRGTSYATPLFASLVAMIDSARASRQLPPVGFLNPTLYRSAAVQATFRDITTGGPAGKLAHKGWDWPTGWGAPNASALDTALP